MIRSREHGFRNRLLIWRAEPIPHYYPKGLQQIASYKPTNEMVRRLIPPRKQEDRGGSF